jgi:flagellar hook-associated protein 3 FlgL
MDITLGDLASLTYASRRSSAIKSEIDALTLELTTGKVRDVSAHLGADLGVYAEIEARLAKLDAFDAVAAESEVFADATQNALGFLSDLSGQLTADFLTASNSGLAGSQGQAAKAARDTLDAMVNTLNGTVAGRSLFAGVATDRRPLEGADAMLTALRGELAGATTAADAMARVSAWFDDPAGFGAVMYDGSSQSLNEIRVAEELGVTFDLRADDPAFRDMFEMAALGALADDPVMALPGNERTAMFEAAGVGFLAANAKLAETAGTHGALQARIEMAASGNAAMRTSLEQTRAELVSPDPFEVAVRLEQAQFQLESLFAVTARSARLSLVNFL